MYNFQEARDDIRALQQPSPITFVFVGNDIALSHATNTFVGFNAELYDDGDWHSTTTNNTRITVDKSGVYVVTASISFASNASGERIGRLHINGGTRTLTRIGANPTNDTRFNLAITLKADAGDYFEVSVYQNSGDTLTLREGSNATNLTVARLNP